MAISDEKLKIVINNYFKSECDVNTSIREAFEKGFRIGVKKGLMQIEADRKTEPSETMSCEECKHYGTNYPCELDFKACRYEPKTEPRGDDIIVRSNLEQFSAAGQTAHGSEEDDCKRILETV